jgi:hypothetical protein
MDYYHSQPIQSPTIKRFSKVSLTSHSSIETGKSVVPEKKISSNIHLFFAQQENEEEDLLSRKPSPIPSMPNLPTKENKQEEKTIEKIPQTKNKTNVTRKNNKKNRNEPSTPKKNTSNEQNKEMYAGGGYAKSPNPKELSKPKLVSPPKKEKKIETKSVDNNSPPDNSSFARRLSFSHSAHNNSAPQLSHSTFQQAHPSNMMPNMMPNMIPNMHSIPNLFPSQQQMSFSTPYYGQVFNMNSNILFPQAPTMTRAEANEDLKMRLNLK